MYGSLALEMWSKDMLNVADNPLTMNIAVKILKKNIYINEHLLNEHI